MATPVENRNTKASPPKTPAPVYDYTAQMALNAAVDLYKASTAGKPCEFENATTSVLDTAQKFLDFTQGKQAPVTTKGNTPKFKDEG
jgi:hypothetical protein